MKPIKKEYETDESEPNSNSDGTPAPRVRRATTTEPTRTVIEGIPMAMNIAPEGIDEYVDNVDNIRGVEATMGATINIKEYVVEGHPMVDEITPTIVDGVPFAALGD